MSGSTRFWIYMALFQVAFGLAVFAVTRHYYAQEPATAVVNRQAQPEKPVEWPNSGAGNDLEQLISAFPGQTTTDDPAMLAARADEYFVNQQYDLAADAYRQLLAVDPHNADTYNNLGITLHYLGRSTEALKVLDQGITVDPEYQRIWLTLGFVNLQLGNIIQARAALTTAVQIDATNDVGQSAAQMLGKLTGN